MLIFCAPFLAVLVERYLDLPEKTALLILSLAFIASVIGGSVGKGVISMGLGLLAAYIGTGEDFYPRLSMGTQTLAQGFSVTTAVLGVLILGEVFKSLEDLWQKHHATQAHQSVTQDHDQKLRRADIRAIAPYIGRSALIGTVIGALPGIGSTLAATMGYSSGARHHARRYPSKPQFGQGAPEGIAATEAPIAPFLVQTLSLSSRLVFPAMPRPCSLSSPPRV